jgi:hypothetical protein
MGAANKAPVTFSLPKADIALVRHVGKKSWAATNPPVHARQKAPDINSVALANDRTRINLSCDRMLDMTSSGPKAPFRQVIQLFSLVSSEPCMMMCSYFMVILMGRFLQ